MIKYMIIIIAVILTMIPSCATIDGLVPKVMAADTQNIVEQVEVNSDDVFSEIQRNIDLVNELKNKVETANIDNKPLSLNDVIKDIKTVSQSYNKLSGKHDAIRKSLLKKISNVEDMQKQIIEQINILRKRYADYYNQFMAISDPNPDIVKTRKEALTQAMSYVSDQIVLWQNFNAIESDITSELVNVQRTIDSFLNVIDSSAILFQEGLNLLVLQRDINNALSLFTQDLPRMEQLTTEMEQSWANLDYLIKTLTSISTLDTIKQ